MDPVRRMIERGFVLYSVGANYVFMTPHTESPVISVKVNLETCEFQGVYVVPGSMNTLETPWCGDVLNDKHFDRIIGKLMRHAKILERELS